MASRDERGFATAQWTVLFALSFILLGWFTNVLLIQYQTASARSALVDAARAAARTPSWDNTDCEAKTKDVLENLLPASKKNATFTKYTCTGTGDPTAPAVTASVQYDFIATSILPSEVSPGLKGTLTVTVQKRQKPVAP